MVRAPHLAVAMGEFTHFQGRCSSLAHLGPMVVPDPPSCHPANPLSMGVPAMWLSQACLTCTHSPLRFRGCQGSREAFQTRAASAAWCREAANPLSRHAYYVKR